MQYFTQDYIDFFRDLEKNNNKEWFHEHKKRYESAVRKPMIKLVTDVMEEMVKVDPEFASVPHRCLGRINRDIRFSKDKTPYNTHMFAHIVKGSKEDALPGIAFRFSGGDSGIMTGFYRPSKERLQRIKENIAGNLPTFQKLKSNKNLVEKFGTIQGEAYKRIPKEWQETYETEKLIANKQFYYAKHRVPEFALSKNLKEEILEYWQAAKKMNDFLGK